MVNVVDLFAGIGAFSQAFDAAGAHTIAQVEFDKYKNKVLEKHFPDVKRFGDIKNVKAEEIKAIGTVDIIAGGSPCPDLSIAGHGAGLAGARSGLWYEYLRLVQEIKPTWVVWENVANALSSNGGRDFREILMGLDECGFNVAWRVLNAEYGGIPQRRRRIFLIGHSRDGRAGRVLFERESVPGNSGTRPKAWKSDTKVAGTLSKSASGTARTGNGNELDFLIQQPYRMQGFGDYTEDSVASTLKKRDHKDATDLVVCLTGWETQNKRIYDGHAEILPTLCKLDHKSGGKWIFRDKLVRRLTPLECTRLMGFPDDYFDGIGLSNTRIYQALGDSIALTDAKWIAKRIMENV